MKNLLSSNRVGSASLGTGEKQQTNQATQAKWLYPTILVDNRMADEMIDEEGLRRSARSQIIVDTIERSLEKMMFVESNLGKEMEPQDLFQVKREAVASVAELKYAISILTGKLEI